MVEMVILGRGTSVIFLLFFIIIIFFFFVENKSRISSMLISQAHHTELVLFCSVCLNQLLD